MYPAERVMEKQEGKTRGQAIGQPQKSRKDEKRRRDEKRVEMANVDGSVAYRGDQ
ncbi:uncharacterized protein TrAtP1_003973 [Trichoderma atroviride]|uniref:uncharacterized protein n=1 Tax=Hypocrea atroviridis TaxID=63577 RepID=UPI0033336E4C|nr:hypothetical protein TrAtP1_003973 [Trichoderma atroviride]